MTQACAAPFKPQVPLLPGRAMGLGGQQRAGATLTLAEVLLGRMDVSCQLPEETRSAQGSLSSPVAGLFPAHWPPRSNATSRKPSLISHHDLYNRAPPPLPWYLEDGQEVITLFAILGGPCIPRGQGLCPDLLR